ncbi:hypothetical protein [Chitinophaga sp. HK235]|uniref:hypothetical protein n=1 Tax=Chitinophaga sp. HK235 TaxID=2952571 RepID=UPI001BAD98E9|nr:hypothetical protein [Chitinophaga sp. HK235]
MVNTDLILKFENTTEEPLLIIIDPPCTDYKLEPGQSLKLKIVDYKSCEDDVSNIIDVRYSTPNAINIDINYSFRLIVVINNEEEVIWGF